MSIQEQRSILLSLLSVVTLLGGCALEESAYPTERSTAECHTMRRCHRAQFDGEHEGLDDCVGDLTDALEDSLSTLGAACTYDADKAAECVRDIRTATCAEAWDTSTLYAACQDVYDCP